MDNISFDNVPNPYEKNNIFIGEQLCDSLKNCLEIYEKNPHCSFSNYLSDWSLKYNLYNNFLKAIFETLEEYKSFKPTVKPKEFKKHIPVLKSIEKDEYFYFIPFIQQYTNASIINFNINWVPQDINQEVLYFELFIEEKYECRLYNASNDIGYCSLNYLVTPPLPEDFSETELVFKEYLTPFKHKPTGLELNIKL